VRLEKGPKDEVPWGERYSAQVICSLLKPMGKGRIIWVGQTEYNLSKCRASL